MVASFVRAIDEKIFKYALSKYYRIAKANFYVRSSPLFARNPVSRIRSIDIEPVAKCNLRCPFCQVPEWHRAYETGLMEVDLFEKIINQFPKLKHIKLQGMGEPFLNNNLIKMIRIAGKKNIKTTILTNGTLLDKALCVDILDSKLTKLCFSFEGATKKTYESLRVGANYEMVVNNIRTICELRNKGRYKTSIYIRCLVSNQVVLDEFSGLVELASDIGVDALHVAHELKIWKTKNKVTYPTEFIAIDSYENYHSIIKKAKKKASKLGINLNIERSNKHKQIYPCYSPWNTLFISVEGNIVPCSNIGSPNTWCMGNLNESGIHKIWNNESYSRLRKSIRLGQIPEFCSTCYNYNQKASRL